MRIGSNEHLMPFYENWLAPLLSRSLMARDTAIPSSPAHGVRS
jgi:hypothetical protein